MGERSGVICEGSPYSFREFWEGVVCGRFVDDWKQDRVELCKEAEY